MSHTTRLLPLAGPFLALTLTLGIAPLHAANDGTGPIATCPRGQVPDGSGKCVKREGRVLGDDFLVDYAYALAREERYQEALETLDLLENPETPKALNYRGYVTRKLGGLEQGIVHYRKAVALDPDYALVREYLGEAYVELGAIDLAREQLREVERICGRECEAYTELASAIDQGGPGRAW